MPDPALQLLLDPDNQRTGLRIQDRVDTLTTADYYVVSNGAGWAGRARWCSTLIGDSDATKNTKIRTQMASG